MRVAFDYMV